MPPRKAPKKVPTPKKVYPPVNPTEIGEAFAKWFALFMTEEVDFMTAGSQQYTDNLTIVLRVPDEETIFCTYKNSEEVFACFVSEVNSLAEKLHPEGPEKEWGAIQ